jgi:serine/threonine protein kinase/Flp pilus assembly protein TadD
MSSAADALLDELIEKLTERLLIGDSTDVEAFLAAHPEHADALRALLPTIELMAGLGHSPADESSGVLPPGDDLDPTDGLGSLGDFRLIREVGRGGMGVVYEAEQVSLGRRVALKLLPMAAAMDPRQIQRFRVEAQAAACLHHPHIVPVHGVGCERGVHYYAMQLIEGQSLAAMIAELRRRDGPDPADGAAVGLAAISTTTLAARLLTGGADGHPGGGRAGALTAALPANLSPPPAPTSGATTTDGRRSSGSSTRNRDYVRNAARLALQAAEALDHAHTRGILHRDIKPANLLLDAEGRLWVTDFGLAQVRGDDRLTLTGDVLGTLRYMSPEQALGRRVVVDGRTDIYSLGVTLYELLTLHPAVDGRDRAEILRRIADGEPPPLRKVNPAAPADLETIALKATAKDPAARYATAQELSDDLRNYLEDRPIRARRPTLADRARRWGRRHRTLAWSAATTALVAVLMLAGGIGYLARDRAARLAQTRQRAAEALAGARTAIEAGDLTLAGQRVAEAEGRLGPERERLPDVAADVDRIRREIEARQADAARFSQFLKGASDGQDKMSSGYAMEGPDGRRTAERVAEEVLGLYGILTEKDWLSRLENSYLTADQKQQVRETAYVTLVSLADNKIRWNWGPREDPKAAARSLDLLQRAQAFHQPTRAFYFVRRVCREQQGDTAAAAEDDKQFKAAPARTAWDYFLPGHTAGWRGDLDEAIRSYQAALRLQPNHYNSLLFLAMRLATDKINRRPEAIAYFTGCIALRPDHIWPYENRGSCYEKLGRVDAAQADFEAALAVAKTAPDRCESMAALGKHYLTTGRTAEAIRLLEESLKLSIATFGPNHEQTFGPRNSLGEAYRKAGRTAEAIRLAEENLKLWTATLAPDDPNTLVSRNNLALAFFEAGRTAEAIRLGEETLKLMIAKLGPDGDFTLASRNNLGYAYMSAGRKAEAIKLLEENLKLEIAKWGPDAPETLESHSNLARAYESVGRWAEAESLSRDVLARSRKTTPPDSPDLARRLSALGINQLTQAKWSEAESVLRECLAIRAKTIPGDWPRFHAMSVLGGALLGQAKYAEAEPLLVQGYEGLKAREARIPQFVKVILMEAGERVVALYEAWGKPDQATAWRAKLPPASAELPADVFARP